MAKDKEIRTENPDQCTSCISDDIRKLGMVEELREVMTEEGARFRLVLVQKLRCYHCGTRMIYIEVEDQQWW